MECSNLSKSDLYPCDLPFSQKPLPLSSPPLPISPTPLPLSSPPLPTPPSSQQPILPSSPLPPLTPPPTSNDEWSFEMLQDVLDKIDHDNLRNSPDILKNIAMKVPEKPIQGIKTIETDKRPNPAHDARIKAIQDKNDDKPEKKNNESTSSSKNRYAPKQKRSSWSKNESEVLKKLHEIYGRRWKTISRFTNTRTPAEVKPPRFWVLYKNKNRYKISSLQVGASKWFPEDKISEIEKWGRTKSQSQSNELGRRETGKQEGIMGSAPLEECSMLAPRMSPTSIIHLVGDLILAMVFSVSML
ncbi:hypothetical protein ACOSQ3_022852 [Xanthoceras sorbifolium]